MNRSRVIVLVVAVLAAGLAALLARSLLGGGTEKSKAAIAPPQIASVDVLVASEAIPAGTSLAPTSVRWQEWPKSNLDDTLITREMAPNLTDAVKGTVARASLIAGEPITTTKIVHADSAGFMAAQLSPGMRAISIAITTESGAGGFILPNDRVDILMTRQVSDSPRTFAAHTILRDIRVLAIGQTYTESKDQKVILGRSATLELTPNQSEIVQRAAAGGTLSLILRPLGDNSIQTAQADKSRTQPHEGDEENDGANVSVIRYSISHANPASDANGE